MWWSSGRAARPDPGGAARHPPRPLRHRPHDDPGRDRARCAPSDHPEGRLAPGQERPLHAAQRPAASSPPTPAACRGRRRSLDLLVRQPARGGRPAALAARGRGRAATWCAAARGRHRRRQRRRAAARELLHLRAAPHERLRRRRASGRSCATSCLPELPRLRKLPDFSRTMVSLMHAPQASARCATPIASRCARECDAFLRAPTRGRRRFGESFMTAASPGHRRRRHAERPLRVDERLRHRRSPTRCGPSTSHRRARLRAADRLPRPGDGAPHRLRRRPLAEFLAATSSCNVAAINRASAAPARARAPARLLGQLRGAARLRRAARGRCCRTLRGATSARWCSRWPTRATRTSTAASRASRCPTTDAADRRRDRHDHQLRRAPRGGRRSDRASPPTPSAIRDRVLAGTDCGFDTAAGSARWPRRWCGRSSARCAPAPTSRAGASGPDRRRSAPPGVPLHQDHARRLRRRRRGLHRTPTGPVALGGDHDRARITLQRRAELRLRSDAGHRPAEVERQRQRRDPPRHHRRRVREERPHPRGDGGEARRSAG